MKTEQIQQFYDRLWEHRRLPYIETEKTSARYAVISDLVNSLPGRKLVAACGPGDDLVVFEDLRDCVALDISLLGLRHTYSRFPQAQCVAADAQLLPFADQCFDLVLCSEVLEHLAKPEYAVDEFARVLRPGGKLVVTVPNWYNTWGLARKVAEFITRKPVTAANQPIDNWFTPQRLRRLLEPRFRIDTMRGIWYLPPLGRGDRQLPEIFTRPLVVMFKPFERSFQRWLPSCGHMLACAYVKRS